MYLLMYGWMLYILWFSECKYCTCSVIVACMQMGVIDKHKNKVKWEKIKCFKYKRLQK